MYIYKILIYLQSTFYTKAVVKNRRSPLINFRGFFCIFVKTYLNIIYIMPFEKGHKHSKGRPPKADEEKANTLMVRALGEIYRKDTDDENKIEFIKESLLKSQRGQIFVAEHIFGKPKETIETNFNTDFNIKDIFKIG